MIFELEDCSYLSSPSYTTSIVCDPAFKLATGTLTVPFSPISNLPMSFPSTITLTKPVASEGNVIVTSAFSPTLTSAASIVI